MSSTTSTAERARIQESLLARGIVEADRINIWGSVDRILDRGPLATGGGGATGLALGYVQSGKTTAITALVAAAADAGYRVVVAILGSTNLLLEQNSQRLTAALGLGEREDYVWFSTTNASGSRKGKELAGWLARGRTLLLPVIKHAGRIDALATVLAEIAHDVPVLIVDDEADQASLNTQVNVAAASRTYEAVRNLRAVASQHLYVQFTATPYAPLLLEADDHLRPDFVEMLQPGHGYTGGREFFIDHAELVVEPIPTLDEQPPKSLPTHLPRSLIGAFANFVAGSALLLGTDPTSPPISMLVHSTQRNDVQARYHFLLDRLLKKWHNAAATSLPGEVMAQRAALVADGAADLRDADFLQRTRYVLAETTLWLVNSASDVSRIDWRVAPIHVLVGGNKLDRGFTVEGLTVTYMNRPPSTQIDTLEQRARAFGYRQDLLPYCKFYATPRTLRVLREIVDTEYDLRANLLDWVASGRDVGDWAGEVGLLLPQGTRPTRQSVVTTLSAFNERPTWHQLRRPSLVQSDREHNRRLVEQVGLLSAAPIAYGRLSHPSLELPLRRVVAELVEPWAGVPVGASPGWRQESLVDLLRRQPAQDDPICLTLMQHPGGGPRSRDWDPSTGFVNLLQGADPRPSGEIYRGDRSVGGADQQPGRIVVQVHYVRSTQPKATGELFTLVVHAGNRQVMRRV